MKEYQYKALNSSGAVVTGVHRASNRWLLTEELSAQNLILLNSRQTLQSFGKTFSIAGRINPRELRDFTLHMATCLAAGIPVSSALLDLENDSGKGHLKNMIAGIRREINSGAQVDEALTKYPEVFSETYIAIVTAGQSTGDLAQAFSNLVDHLEWLDDLHGKSKQALVYPALMIAGIIGLFMLMLFYVLPRFMDMFKFQDSQLPAVTLFVMGAFDWFTVWWPAILAASAAMIVGYFTLRKSVKGRYLIDDFMLRLPVVGGFVHKLALARFSRYFSLLFAAGTSLLNVLELLIKVVGNNVLAVELKDIRDRVMTGETLTSSFSQAPHFPPMIQRLVAVGEKTGQLDNSLIHAADYLDKEIPRELKQAFTILNALIITVLGGLIAIAALSILLPVMQMRNMM
ncbi:MAG: type II secretion system F family protein [Candidatus Krumholzibacteriota bacterium]|nr:type II secretion system F family protein [Candidatus Krumholzibacteriota bacterium]